MRSDEELAVNAARGDASAFEALILRYQRPLLNFAFRMLGDADEAADAAQQSFVQAYYHLPRAKLDLPFKPWIFRIARNQCIDRIRERRTISLSAMSETDDEGAGVEFADHSPLPEDLAEQNDLQQILTDAISLLPERYRAVVSMRYVTDLTFAEIAIALNLSENTVKTFFQRAKAMLRADLARKISAD